MITEDKLLSIAHAMKDSKRFYTVQGLASAMGLSLDSADYIFNTIQNNKDYVVNFYHSPYSVKILKIKNTTPVIKHDAKASIAALNALREKLWNDVLGVSTKVGA